MDAALSIALGLGLAAACGFRVFVPFLVVSVVSRGGALELGESFAWMSSTPVLVLLIAATALEVFAYYVPWLDNLLDTLATPAAIVAGGVLAASVVTGIDPWLKWSLAVIAGGGLAGAVQLSTVGARGASTLLTGGLGNFGVSTVELLSSLVLSILSVLWPFFALVLLAIVLLVVARRRSRADVIPG